MSSLELWNSPSASEAVKLSCVASGNMTSAFALSCFLLCSCFFLLYYCNGVLKPSILQARLICRGLQIICKCVIRHGMTQPTEWWKLTGRQEQAIPLTRSVMGLSKANVACFISQASSSSALFSLQQIDVVAILTLRLFSISSVVSLLSVLQNANCALQRQNHLMRLTFSIVVASRASVTSHHHADLLYVFGSVSRHDVLHWRKRRCANQCNS